MAGVDLDADPAIHVSDLSLSYPAHGGGRSFHAVEGVSFDVRRGEVLALLGESGSGKSTLARFLAGRAKDTGDKSARIRATGGDAHVLGTSMRRLNRRGAARLTAYVGHLAQDAGATLPPELNVGDILFGPIVERTKDFDRDELGAVVAEMMDIVGLPLSKLQEYPYELSKGQRQRVAVMRSLMLNPPVLVADEPTLGVDANSRPRIVDLLRWYRERSSATLVLISHDIGMLEALVQDVLVMQQGRVVGHDDINAIFRQADHVYVQQLAQALRATAYDEIADE
ncbi:ABC transporter ATP-binding protein [Leucobacter sp. OLJS4]|uniref:ATP-binding cassette domain-containing protein n=1 Tax=unclassified Leucobacter TaxID=2621730 RepID=UPI000C191121|nr:MULTISPECIES: ATP-binding cassette domain-containing protein [unclassified Leucobacter]PII81489.1 ABC transporter ATP-binding protein [Leucobacter sp. OLCALW19]PII86159.1 ABC transporter ATP-binding protein [Leucobacter sp. OLTLW20]PII90054.1 ABC transporter ATP-binding protein [Leucobacter sp. OLAS13]PII97087.1 ABC transporter ATP-binding protein [Leucobacter sp. OLDS2]PIJ02219.1 ABC transporter ATP-binding protein [Leucobacter sp. OLIS6]